MREAELDACMDRLARGDRTAFEPLHAPLRARASRLVAARLGKDGAEDVVQSALTKVFGRASEFVPGRPCLPWFYAIVANEIRAARRKNAHDVPSEIDEAALVATDDPEAALAAREIERALEIAIDALDVEAANTIHALLGRAPMPDVPPATFRKRVSRAYAKLRLLLGGHDAG